MHFSDPAGMGDGAIVGVEDPGILWRGPSFDLLIDGIHRQVATDGGGAKDVSLGVVGQHHSGEGDLFFSGSGVYKALGSEYGIVFVFIP